MSNPTSKLFLFTALTGVLLLPALSFAGPNGNGGQGKWSKAKHRKVQTKRAHARRTVATNKPMRRHRHAQTYRAPPTVRVVHVQKRARLVPTRHVVPTRRYKARGFQGNSVSVLQRGACRTNAVRYPSGRLAAAGQCRRGLKRGTWTAYDRKGRTIGSAQFRRGVQLSSWTRYNGHGRKVYRQARRLGKVHTPSKRVRIAYYAR